MSQEESQKLKCSYCNELLSVQMFYKFADTTKPNRKRRYSYACVDCTAENGKEYRSRPEVRQRLQAYQREWQIANRTWHRAYQSDYRQHRANYFRYTNEPCDKTPSCEKTLAHYSYCTVNGKAVISAEVRRRNQERRRQWYSKRRSTQRRPIIGKTGPNHIWRGYNKILFKKKIHLTPVSSSTTKPST